jgi:DNA helicase-2/ATP-dependent DNA helicase PcrA
MWIERTPPTTLAPLLDAGDAADLLDMVRQEAGRAESARRFPCAGTLLDIYSRTVNAQRPLSEVITARS